ncbi:MAG: hypothetical protein JNJ60_10850, partial [Rhodocyclaceae bacterium]|nr:hypothetical protein [Rhodocyclaceae bacterium]
SRARGTADLTENGKIEGFWESTIKTALLNVNVINPFVASNHRATGDAGGVFIGPADDQPQRHDPVLGRDIFWEAHVILLGEPNPILEIDADGYITKLSNISFLGANAGKTVGQQLVPYNGNYQVILDDIVYDEAGEANFFASAITGEEKGRIWGNRGLIESQRTWDSVTITNYSQFDLVVNHIDTYDGGAVVNVTVDDIKYAGDNDANNNQSLHPDDPAKLANGTATTPTFEFDLNLLYPQTNVVIRNLAAGGAAPSDILLYRGIENTIGFTTIENQRGNIRVDEADLVAEQSAVQPGDLFLDTHPASGSPYEEGLIRTNRLYVDATGDIGNQSATNTSDGRGNRRALAVELVRIEHRLHKNDALVLSQVDLEVEAKDGDAVLDITLHDRSNSPPLASLAVTIDLITAGDDVDVVVNDSKAGDNAATLDGVTV